MGWLYMQSLKGHSGPRQYLDAQFTFERPEATSKVLRSALVGMRVYYAAVEQIRIASGEREVWALICLVRYNPRDPEGYIFGYKESRPRSLRQRLGGGGRRRAGIHRRHDPHRRRPVAADLETPAQ